MDAHSAIGVFDSGLGGLTVVKELISQLPREHIVYFGDTARVPYGTKSKESIIQFSHENTKTLIQHKVKMVVVACNSSSSYAMSALKRDYDLPILGVIEPGARRAVESTSNNRIGVIATSATIKSDQYARHIRKYNAQAKVTSQACPLFVPLVEEGWFSKPATKLIAKEYLQTLKQDEIDTLILGCTHYPLLKDVVQTTMGRNVKLVDSATEVASRVKEILKEKKLERPSGKVARYKFLVSDKPQEFGMIAKNFLGRPIRAIKI